MKSSNVAFNEELVNAIAGELWKKLMGEIGSFVRDKMGDGGLKEESVELGLAVSRALGSVSGEYLRFCGDHPKRKPGHICGTAVVFFQAICGGFGVDDFVECSKIAADNVRSMKP